MDIRTLIKKPINSSIEYNDKMDFIAIQFMNGDKQQYYVLKNRRGQYDVILSYPEVQPFIRDNKKISIMNINQIDEESRTKLIEKIKNIYLSFVIDIN